MITGIDLCHRVHQLMVQLLRLVRRLLIKSKKNSSSSVVHLIWLRRFPPLYFSKATWTIFMSVNLCRPFFIWAESWTDSRRIYSLTRSFFLSNSCSFYSPVVVFHQSRFFVLFLTVIHANFSILFFTIFERFLSRSNKNNKCQKQRPWLFPKKQIFLSLS